jgi:hypothetical protein
MLQLRFRLLYACDGARLKFRLTALPSKHHPSSTVNRIVPGGFAPDTGDSGRAEAEQLLDGTRCMSYSMRQTLYDQSISRTIAA